MDLCAEMLLEHWPRDKNPLQSTRLCPAFRRLAGQVPWLGGKPFAFNVDRLINRWCNYPLYLRRRSKEHALFHVSDHSYAHLVHHLPAGGTGVYCHDLDAFACLLHSSSQRPRWFRAMMRRVLAGLQKAAVVFHSTLEVRRQIEQHGLLDTARLVHAPYGIAPEFASCESDPVHPLSSASHLSAGPYLLHVGSCIPRKRIDLLLEIFAAVRRVHPQLRLVQIGGQWTRAHQEQMQRLGICGAVTQRQGLTRSQIAQFYRRASLVLQTSEAEGFGMPVIEALACGAVVVASDIPVLREVGGDAVLYCPAGDAPTWADRVAGLLDGELAAPDRMLRIEQASRYSWSRHAEIICTAYQRLLQGPPAA